MVTAVAAGAAKVVIEKVPLVEPAATVTVAGTDASEELLLLS